ncbi:sensor histidine kinase [Legionella bononiensis]|uniref:histidine kinase n=1 Tax=Legionella bononiensis TaxID=2793102 RepID=A0ABS1W6Q4_9GAMM|nr:sensor histidine kinase KdpD [Legionella bononiensis]MBL7478456.1 sensor histidine kinase KdpD [Legionella bononiensis]MBL7525053.1 sensor histidine kinase KdpD [Legionella bononiensis]MBL7561349.1 sensor histidine kinase KdpD [Legionella bononiensis]
MVNQRLSPEQLLQQINEEELKERRGKLKIYLGASPGVGKTYSMLHDALEKRSKNLDVVVGVAESHGRVDINAMLEQLEIMPRQTINYRDRECQEFDLDAALKRHPGLILVDEMAHTNVPGLRHEKRWQDIKELLDKGIDVYTTLNVQHIESLNDDVARIIQAPIKETVPDSMIERADAIELIDIPPEELLKRLHEGKIYFPKQAELAGEHFFRKGNLIALRELALRITAARVGSDAQVYRHDAGIKEIWATNDKILVCVGPRPEVQSLIRSAKRIANSLQAEWIAVYVDTPKLRSSSQQRNSAIQNLRLAELLGAETYVLTGFDIVKEIINFSREQNVTQIIIWKHVLSRWQSWFRRNLSDEVVRQSGDIDVYIITGEETKSQPVKSTIPHSFSWKSYGISIGIVAFVTVTNILIEPVMTSSNLVMMYLLGVTVTALCGQIGPSILASVLSVLSFDFFFVPPVNSFEVSDVEYFFTLLVMLLISQIISNLTILARRQAESSRITQSQTTALYTLNRQLTRTRGVNHIIELGTNFIAKVFNSDVLILIPINDRLMPSSDDLSQNSLDLKEYSIAQWVYEMKQPAGLGTDTLAFSNALYLPIMSSVETIGVLRIQPKDGHLFTPEQMKLLESCINHVSLALEVDRLQEKERRKDLEKETDKARTALLQSIVHDLSSPLKQVIKAVNSLKKIEGAKVRIIEEHIDYEIDKLNRLNTNLHLIIQLEAEKIPFNKTPSSLIDVINSVIESSKNILKERTVQTNIPENLPLVLVDQHMIKEVFIHLFDNAIKYSPPKTPIYISVHIKDYQLVVSIEDFGSGIAHEEKSKLFKKFYRGKGVLTEHGLGLGLAICQKIIAAHDGQIWVENVENKGAAFRFTLPIVKD